MCFELLFGRKEKSCGAVVYREGKKGREYLILHYGEGHWDFPKGHVEKGESEEETARREIKEETGIALLEFDHKFRTYISYSVKRGGQAAAKTVVFFIAKTDERKVKLSDEHTKAEWLCPKEAEKRLTYENARSVLRMAEARIKSVSA